MMDFGSLRNLRNLRNLKLNNIQKRFIGFLIGCVGLRLGLVLLARQVGIHATRYLPLLGAIALIPAIGWFTIFFNNSRKTGVEVFGDKIWWNDLRPIHAILYLTFSYLAFTKNKNAFLVLLADVKLGLFAFILYHFYFTQNYKKLGLW